MLNAGNFHGSRVRKHRSLSVIFDDCFLVEICAPGLLEDGENVAGRSRR